MLSMSDQTSYYCAPRRGRFLRIAGTMLSTQYCRTRSCTSAVPWARRWAPNVDSADPPVQKGGLPPIGLSKPLLVLEQFLAHLVLDLLLRHARQSAVVFHF